MKGILCATPEEFAALNERVQQGLLADVKNYKADRWCREWIVTGSVYFTVEDRILRYLTADELTRIVEIPTN